MDDNESFREGLVQLAILTILIVLFQVIVGRVGLEKEAQRRWQHALTGQALVGCSYVLDVWMCQAGLLIGTAGLVFVKEAYPKQYQEAFGPLLRPHERDSLPGAFYFLLGTLAVVSLVELPLARYAVLCLSYADPAAAWIGRNVPLVKIHAGASLGGCLACFATAVGLGLAMHLGSPSRILLGALACTVSEAFPVGNDNLLIPLVTAGAATLVE